MSEAPDLSIEDEVRAAMSAHSAEETIGVDESDVTRDDAGRFKAANIGESVIEGNAAIAEAGEPEAVATEEVDPFAEPPSYAKKSVRDSWSSLPAEVRRDLTEREKEVHQQFTRFDEERQAGKRFKEVLSPHEPFIKSLGAEPLQAVDYLLKTDYALRTAGPEQRVQLFIQAARDYGVDPAALAQQASVWQENYNPVVETMQQRINRLENQLQSVNVERTASVDADIARTIEDFASKPENAHFERVAPLMQILLQNGQAQTLEEAYDRAIYADPEVRALHLSTQRESEERKRTEAVAAKAAAARNASVSVTGAPGLAVPTPPMESSGSLEDDIRNAIRAAAGG